MCIYIYDYVRISKYLYIYHIILNFSIYITYLKLSSTLKRRPLVSPRKTCHLSLSCCQALTLTVRNLQSSTSVSSPEPQNPRHPTIGCWKSPKVPPLKRWIGGPAACLSKWMKIPNFATHTHTICVCVYYISIYIVYTHVYVYFGSEGYKNLLGFLFRW